MIIYINEENKTHVSFKRIQKADLTDDFSTFRSEAHCLPTQLSEL